jgi:threonine synthase
MMTTLPDSNVHALAIEGTFDDCQAIVKGLFNHQAFRERVHLSGVNSINWARIVAQVVYYFTAAVSLGSPNRKVAFTVPTGNFGDVFAGYVATRMGLPVEHLVVATNVNDILVRTLTTGIYDVRSVAETSSPSMDIQISSNFERLLFDAYDEDPLPVRKLMESLSRTGRFTIAPGALNKIRERFTADRADEDETASTIRTVYKEAGYLLDPHTAVAVAVAEKQNRGRSTPMIILSTAHPAKFPAAVKAASGITPHLPDWLGDLNARPERVTVLPNDQGAVETFITAASRAAQGVAA